MKMMQASSKEILTAIQFQLKFRPLESTHRQVAGFLIH
jgi:hypothetical protein